VLTTAPLALAVNAEHPPHKLAALVAYAKANPRKHNYGASIGTPPHLAGEMFNVLT
jgi:tripartite-type tricarboxylate transporter receptor subunit TctC